MPWQRNDEDGTSVEREQANSFGDAHWIRGQWEAHLGGSGGEVALDLRGRWRLISPEGK